MVEKLKFYPLGERAIQIKFGEEPNVETSQQIRNFCSILETEQIEGVLEWVPTYLSVTLYYDPYRISCQELQECLQVHLSKEDRVHDEVSRIVYIPVCYSEEFGLDIEEVAIFHSITKEEVIRLHTNAKYYVHMIGFTPGFPYLGGLNKLIATPRKATPRLKVSEGSVGIAGSQTGIYPLTSPGGWQIIGRTPIKLFNVEKENPVLLRAGDYLKFESISVKEYEWIQNDVKKDQYKLRIEGGESFEIKS